MDVTLLTPISYCNMLRTPLKPINSALCFLVNTRRQVSISELHDVSKLVNFSIKLLRDSNCYTGMVYDSFVNSFNYIIDYLKDKSSEDYISCIESYSVFKQFVDDMIEKSKKEQKQRILTLKSFDH